MCHAQRPECGVCLLRDVCNYSLKSQPG
ncbi:hypothetical protein [Klebsiella pneumoniae]